MSFKKNDIARVLNDRISATTTDNSKTLGSTLDKFKLSQLLLRITDLIKCVNDKVSNTFETIFKKKSVEITSGLFKKVKMTKRKAYANQPII